MIADKVIMTKFIMFMSHNHGANIKGIINTVALKNVRAHV